MNAIPSNLSQWSYWHELTVLIERGSEILYLTQTLYWNHTYIIHHKVWACQNNSCNSDHDSMKLVQWFFAHPVYLYVKVKGKLIDIVRHLCWMILKKNDAHVSYVEGQVKLRVFVVFTNPALQIILKNN